MASARDWQRNGAGQIVIDPARESDDEETGLQQIYAEARSAIAGADDSPAPAPQATQAQPSALTIRAGDWRIWAGAALGAFLIVIALGAALNRGDAAPLAAPPTAAAAPSAPPAATPFGTAIDVAMVAYFDPHDLSKVTALEHGTRVEPIARIGHEWLQFQLADGSAVWVRWRDLPAPSPAILDQLPDLAPQPTDAPPAPTAAPAAPAYVAPPIVEDTPEPAPTDAPTPVPPATPDVAVTSAAFAASITATHTSICATASANGIPSGVGGACR